MITKTKSGKDIAYHAFAETPHLYCAYGDTLADALFAAARRIKRIEEKVCGFDVSVNPPYSYDSDGLWTVNVYAIFKE